MINYTVNICSSPPFLRWCRLQPRHKRYMWNLCEQNFWIVSQLFHLGWWEMATPTTH